MLVSRQLWFLRRTTTLPLSAIFPAVAGCLMLCATSISWIKDPLGESYTAWNVPVDIGWQFRVGILNYGLLCCCCAIYLFVIAWAHWKPFRGSHHFLHRHTGAGWLCAIPVLLFLFQFFCVDVRWLDTLTQHKIQILLVQYHLGYSVDAVRIPIDPFHFDSSTLLERLQLFVNQVSAGALLPCLSALLLIDYKRLSRTPPITVVSKKPRTYIWPVVALLLLIGLGRAPISMLCEFQAKASLSVGNYTNALGWLNAALTFNPALEQVAYFHEERGQALYFSQSGRLSDDSHAYLASVYREQGDYLDAYQQMLAVWQANRAVPWVIDNMSITLERLAEFTRPINGPPIRRQITDDTALPWLQTLAKVDANNVYSRYVIARIQCDLHNYLACMAQMQFVIHISADSEILSSAYTYLALSEAGQGQYVLERSLLLEAIDLDPNYYNNTAREELSGLR